jgi:hypothetical protein
MMMKLENLLDKGEHQLVKIHLKNQELTIK